MLLYIKYHRAAYGTKVFTICQILRANFGRWKGATSSFQATVVPATAAPAVATQSPKPAATTAPTPASTSRPPLSGPHAPLSGLHTPARFYVETVAAHGEQAFAEGVPVRLRVRLPVLRGRHLRGQHPGQELRGRRERRGHEEGREAA